LPFDNQQQHNVVKRRKGNGQRKKKAGISKKWESQAEGEEEYADESVIDHWKKAIVIEGGRGEAEKGVSVGLQGRGG